MNTNDRLKAGQDLIRGVELLSREKQIPTDVIFSAIEKAIRLAIMKVYDDEEGIVVTIDRNKGFIHAQKGDKVLEPEELGRIPAQAAKQQMIQMFREEESNSVYGEFEEKKGELVGGTIHRFEGGAALVTLGNGKTEAILPRSEQIPGETHHNGEKIKAIILEVKKVGHRVKIILSRTHSNFVRRLFEKEIPEIEDRTIEMKAIAREAGYRTKVAVSSIDMKVDCVGACVGVRGSRIKNIVEVLGGERIDIVRWNESPQVLIPNALQPATVDEVFLYPRLRRAVVLVKEDQLSLAIGRRGQNVRLASKLVDWDIEIMTHEELANSVDKAEGWFRAMPGITDEMVEALLEEGFLSYDDLTYLEPHELVEMTGVTEDQAEEIIEFAQDAAEEVEEEVRASKAREAAGAPAVAAAPAALSTADKVAQLFPDTAGAAAAPAVAEDKKRAFENLFAPAPAAPAEPEPAAPIVAEQPADAPAPATPEPPPG
jgi:N utilization substance protein A